jgi:hypothetical protein
MRPTVSVPNSLPGIAPQITGGRYSITRPRKAIRMKCRYCLRQLRVVPHTPLEIEPHCTAAGCQWCVECSAGQTRVSPRWSGADDPAEPGRGRNAA